MNAFITVGLGRLPLPPFPGIKQASRLSSLPPPSAEPTSSSSATTISSITISPKASTSSTHKAAAAEPSLHSASFGQSEPSSDTLARILSCDHIILNVLRYADRPTQAACLRVSRSFHHLAGKFVYRYLNLQEDTLWDVLRGALVGKNFRDTGSILKALNICDARQCQTQLTLAVICAWLSADSMARVNNLLPRSPRRAEAERLFPDFNPSQIKKVVLPILCLDKLAGSTDKHDNAYTENFKAPLLRHVRVLTVGSHNSCICHIWAPLFDVLMPNVQVLRLAPARDPHTNLLPLCLPGNGCQFLRLASLNKVVFRNVDGHGLPLPFDKKLPLDGITSVVVVLPTNGLSWTSDEPITFEPLETHFGNADVKVIFHDTWEGTPHPLATSSHIPVRAPLDPALLVYSFFSFLPGPDEMCIVPPQFCVCSPGELAHLGDMEPTRRVAVYGLGKLRFERSGFLYDRFARVHGPSLTDKQLLDCVRNSISLRKYGIALSDMRGSELNELPEWYTTAAQKWYSFHTFKDYIADEAGRAHELNAED